MPQPIVLITGCSSGIGKETALYFASKQWRVIATARDISTMNDLSSQQEVEIYPLDVTKEDDIARVVSHVQETYGRLDVLVHNAGYGTVGPFEASTPQETQDQFDVNVFGVMNLTREFLPLLREAQGTIVAVSSIGGRMSFPLYSLYHATKWGLEGFLESLQYELAALGVRVRLVEPGPVRTAFNGRSQKVLKKPNLNVYNPLVTQVYPRLQIAGEKGIQPGIVAQSIYKAARSRSSRLRYVVPGSRALMVVRKLLPESLWRNVVRGVFRL